MEEAKEYVSQALNARKKWFGISDDEMNAIYDDITEEANLRQATAHDASLILKMHPEYYEQQSGFLQYSINESQKRIAEYQKIIANKPPDLNLLFVSQSAALTTIVR